MSAPALVLNVPFSKGQFMIATWTTQAANKVTVTLQDSATTYINGVSRQSTNPLPIAPVVGQQLTGTSGTLKLTISIPGSTLPNLLSQPNSSNILDNQGNIVGVSYSLSVEDGSDNDFNDVWVSLVAWNTSG